MSDEPIPPPSWHPYNSGPGLDAVVARVGGTVDGRVMVTFRNPNGPEAFNVFLDVKQAKRLLGTIPSVLTALNGRNN